jgi:exopolyphosphatase/guanosine-5'-triphosphate,3'-diphosphate pyrophosphatase
VKLGVARLSERFLDSERLGSKQIAELDAHIAAELAPILTRASKHQIRRIIGTSGTMLNVIAIASHLRDELPDGRLNNLTVSAEEIARVKRLVLKSDRDERLRIKGLDAKRVDFIVPGACLADYILQQTKAPEMVACTWALREGVLLDFISRHRRGIEEAELYQDPRRRSVARFMRHLGDLGPHGAHTARLALQLFDQLEEILKVPAEARQWLEYAALMHDIGHHIGHKDHQKHSYYLISHGELLGFQPEELQIIALTVRYHQKATPKEGDEGYAALSKNDRRTVRTLSALLRVADALDRSHYGVVRDLGVVRREGAIAVQLFTANEDAELEIWEARRRSGLLDEILECSTDFQVIAQKEDPDAHRTASISR